MELNRVTRKVRLDSRLTAIRYQLVTELIFLRKQAIIDSDLTYLALLVQWGPMSLKEFCNRAVLEQYGQESLRDAEKHPVRVQTVRNRLGILHKRGYIIKEGKGNKTLRFNPSINIETQGNILLEYNFIYVETEKSQELNTRTVSTAASL